MYILKKYIQKLGIEVYAFNPGTPELGAGGSLWVQEQPGVHRFRPERTAFWDSVSQTTIIYINILFPSGIEKNGLGNNKITF